MLPKITLLSKSPLKKQTIEDTISYGFLECLSYPCPLQVPQPIGFENGKKALENRLKVVLRHRPNLYNETDLIIGMESYLTKQGKEYIYVFLIDCDKPTIIHSHNHYCVTVENFELFSQEILSNLNHVYGSTTTYGQILHTENPEIDPKDWMKYEHGQSRSGFLKKALVIVLDKYTNYLNKCNRVYFSLENHGVFSCPRVLKELVEVLAYNLNEPEYVVCKDPESLWFAVLVAQHFNCGVKDSGPYLVASYDKNEQDLKKAFKIC